MAQFEDILILGNVFMAGRVDRQQKGAVGLEGVL